MSTVSISSKLLLLACLSTVALIAQQNNVSTAAVPTRVFAPYVDIGKPMNNLPQIQAASGVKFFTLAFLLAQGNTCMASWTGATPIANDATFPAYIAKVREAGGDVIFAFGGYDGVELAQACSDVASLQAAYQSVVDKYKAKILDFDVEHLAIEDPASVDRRSQALTALVAANPGLRINYTLPATSSGLTDKAQNVLTSAVAFHTPVWVVNLMAMDYGTPIPNGAMGPDAVAAASAALCQMRSIGLDASVGITPMIGVNDSPGETFGLDDARTVFSYAQANSKVALLSFWSIGRDNGSCSLTVSPTCSGVSQPDWEFSRIFSKFQ